MTKIHYGVKPDIFKNAPLPPRRPPETKGWERGLKGEEGGWGRRGLHKVTPYNGWVMALNRGHNSTRRPPERERKKRTKFGAEEGGAAEGGPVEGGSAVIDPGEGGFWGSCRGG